jgi:pectin methylesterase-like acyl-CoA thioesterase
MLGLALLLCWAGDQGVSTVAADGSADFKTVQAAVDAAPSTGITIRIRPGTYREKLMINKPHIQLRGTGADASKTVLSYDDSAGTAGGTTKSASVTVSGDDFYAENLTMENTFSRTRVLTQEGSQAVALRISGDRSVLRNVRFLGFQDTLYATGKPARQYFADCYVEGNVDFIFGDARAFFENCEIRSKAHPVVFITAQSKLHADEKSGYVFDHCRLTAEPDAKVVYLGRPWRAYASVVFMNTEMGAWIAPEGWHEWEHDGKASLPSVFYAEYKSSGPGADLSRKQLSDAEAKRFAVMAFFDRWNPTEVR